jgi:hypothetical protein
MNARFGNSSSSYSCINCGTRQDEIALAAILSLSLFTNNIITSARVSTVKDPSTTHSIHGKPCGLAVCRSCKKERQEEVTRTSIGCSNYNSDKNTSPLGLSQIKFYGINNGKFICEVYDGNQMVSNFDPNEFKMATSLKERRWCIYYLH